MMFGQDVLKTVSGKEYLDNLQKETGFPCIDPLMDGCGIIVDTLNEIFN
jgi:hypothetical protein